MAGFKFFVGEIFHRFIVKQAVDGAGAAGRFRLIGLTNKGQPPFGGKNGESHIGHHRYRHDQCEPGIVIPQQQPDHHADFQQGGQNVEHHETQQKADAVGAPLNITGQPAGAAIEMKIQIQGMQMPKYLQTDSPHGPLGNTTEQGVAQLTEQDIGETHHPIGQQQTQRQGNQLTGVVGIQPVNDVLENKRQPHAGQLGQHQADHRQGNAGTEFQQIGKQGFQHRPVDGLGGNVLAHTAHKKACLEEKSPQYNNMAGNHRMTENLGSRLPLKILNRGPAFL